MSEESQFKPKPMVEIGNRPILWHIMKSLYHYGIREFIICAGYKQDQIKQFFNTYHLSNADLTFDFSRGDRQVIHSSITEKWKVTVIDTGIDTMTGGRIKRIRKYVGNEPFLMTYGDGVSDIDINALIEFHKSHGKLATLTAVHPAGRFGILSIENDVVKHFGEKTESETDWINGGFMILEPEIMDYIKDDTTVFESDTLAEISSLGQLMAYKHPGFWQCMDNLRDKLVLEKLWESGEAPWKNWE